MFQALFGLKPRDSQRTTRPIEQLTAHELSQRLKTDKSIILVDVRTPREFEYDGHISGSRLIPLPVLMQQAGELPKDKTIVCVCRSGSRSQMACKTLSQHGFENVINLRGGMIGWKLAQLPTK